MSPSVVLVAHRAGNDPAASEPLMDRADLIELDIHRFRGRIEVRHAKALWPTRRLFEGWTLLPRSTPRPCLTTVLSSIPEEQRLWLDLKGPDPRLATAVAHEIGDRPVWVSARCWWQLAPFRSDRAIPTFASVGTAWQRWLVCRAPFAGWSDGIVIHDRLVDQRFMAERPSGAEVVVWAVEHLDRVAELLALGVSGLILDDLRLIDRVRDAVDAPGDD